MTDYEGITTKDFKIQPVEITNKFHESGIEQTIDLSVADSAYAILDDLQYKEWMEIFNDADGPMYEDDFTSCMRFKVGNNNFVLVSDCGDDICYGLLQIYCEKVGIVSQFHIDCSLLTKVDYDIDWSDEDSWGEEIYTGAGEDHPELIEVFYKIQHGE